MSRLLLLLLFLAALQGCSACRDLMNLRPMRSYAEELVAVSEAHLEVRNCRVFPGSRKGFCVLEGSTDAVDSFGYGLQLTAQPPERSTEFLPCLVLDAFGVEEGSGRRPARGVRLLRPPGDLPKSSDNVVLVAAYAAPSSICLEMRYPYG